MARERQRRSLLKIGTPIPRQRLLRTPQALRVVPDEDPPIAPRLLVSHKGDLATVGGPARLPPDPSMVEFDLTERDFPELEVDSFEELEELEDTPPPSTPPLPPPLSSVQPPGPPPAPPVGGWVPPQPAPSAPVVQSVLELPLPQSPLLLLARMAVAFVTAMFLTMFVILIPWFAVVVPQIDGAREARRAQNRATPLVVAAPAVAAPAPAPIKAEAPAPTDVPELKGAQSSEPERAGPTVEEVAAPVVPVKPRSASTSSSARKDRSPKPRTTAVRTRRAPPSEPPPVPAAVVPSPEVKKPEPVKAPAPKPQAPAKDRALGGGMKGSVGHAPLSFRLRVLAGGVLSATIVRDGVSHIARGTYNMSGNEASFQLRESGGGASYSGKLGAGGASGRATLPDGSKERFKVKR